MFRPILLATAASLAVSSAPVFAQEDESDIIVVTGASIRAQSDETLQAVDVLSVDEILENFDGSLGATLADLPGLSTTSFGPAVGRPIIRGLGGDRVRVLTNGVGLVDASTVSVDHATTTEALDAERIDILRGPAAIAYGGNAVGGVINVIDGRVPSTLPEDLVDGQFFGGYTSVDEGYQFAGRAKTAFGPLVVQMEGSHRETSDFDIPGFAESALFRALEEEEHEHEEEEEEHEEGEEDHEDEHEEEEEAFGSVENSDFTFNSYGGGFSFVGEKNFAGISIRHFDANYGLPGHDHAHEDEHHDDEEDHDEEEDEDHDEDEHDHEEEEGDARLDMKQLRVDARGSFEVDLGPFTELTFAAGWADYEHAELEGSGEVGTLFSNKGAEARVALINGEPGGRWSGSTGVQALRSDFSAIGEEAFVPPVETNDIGIFGAQRFDLGGYGFEGGARFENRTLEPTGDVDQEFNTVSLSAGAFARPMTGVFTGVNLARTERAPTNAELFSNGPHLATETFELGDSNLDKESAWALDATVHYNGGGWHVEAGAFYTDYVDFIFLAPTGEEDEEEELPIFQYLQDDAVLWGGELFVERDIAQFGPWTLLGDGTVEYVRAETDTLGDLPRIPPLSGILGVGLERDILDLRAEVELVAEQDKTATFELPTDGYTFVNLSATARPLQDRDVRLSLQLLNATDEEGRLHTSQLKDVIPLAGRSVRVAVSTKF